MPSLVARILKDGAGAREKQVLRLRCRPRRGYNFAQDDRAYRILVAAIVRVLLIAPFPSMFKECHYPSAKACFAQLRR